MAFPSTSGATPVTLESILQSILSAAGQIRQSSVTLNATSLAGPVWATDVVIYTTNLARSKSKIVALVGTTGLTAYAVESFPSLDIVASYTLMIAQLDATVAWIYANFPKAASGELLERKFNSDGTVLTSTFSTATLATFRTQLDLLIAQIAA